MKFYADLHIHSHFSIATSKQLAPEYLDHWARLKGIKVVGTGDFTHPGWIKELKEKLEPAEQGLFKLKEEYKLDKNEFIPVSVDKEMRFLLSAEISNIYKKGDKVRKIHNVILAPDFTTVEKIQQALQNIGGNIISDGRPIIGMDARDLLELCLQASENIFFIPAHIWTPWFSALGDKSGFDSIDHCYRDLTHHIQAVETGLSTDAPMHWMCSFLDKFTLLSNSDAHSPNKLGRNANIFDTEMSYNSIIDAIKTADGKTFQGTVDLFPQEGKYHYDGHRKCGVCWNPVDTLKNNGICPECGKKVTIGVMNRTVQLSDRKDLSERKNRLPFHSTIPLSELISEIKGVGPNTKTVAKEYSSILENLGSELNILLHIPTNRIEVKGYPLLAEAIKRMRAKKVFIQEGFDGQFGIVKAFTPEELIDPQKGMTLFQPAVKEPVVEYKSQNLLNFSLAEYRVLEQKKNITGKSKSITENKIKNDSSCLNSEQIAAVENKSGPSLILAGPGSGKTRTLTYKISYLINDCNTSPEEILAVTFTNKAAEEMRERLSKILSNKAQLSAVTISTFHSLGLQIIGENLKHTGRSENFILIDEKDKLQILKERIGLESNYANDFSKKISIVKQEFTDAEDIEGELSDIYDQYNEFCINNDLFDIDDLIYLPVAILQDNQEVFDNYKTKFQWILIDEYQDINHSQYLLIKLLMPQKNGNLCAIGDPNQAIYGFRGANVEYIKKFSQDYHKAKIFNLKQSYRCSDNILQTTSKLIECQESYSFLKGVEKGVKVKIASLETDKSEAEFVARSIEERIGGLRFFSIDSDITKGSENIGGDSLSDFAVLCRISRQMRVIQKAFNDHSIPYQMVSNTPFYQQKPISIIIDLLKLIKKPDNDFIANKFTGKNIITNHDLVKIKDFIEDKTVTDSIKYLINNQLKSITTGQKILLDKLLVYSEKYGRNLDDFLNHIALYSGVDTYQPNVENVTLMTLHAAKGLEFKYVFIVGCENGLLPYSLYKNHRGDVAEERRLLYVGMTRAKKYLYLSCAKKRFLMGSNYFLERSPFIDTIEKELVEISQSKLEKKKIKKDNQLSLF